MSRSTVASGLLLVVTLVTPSASADEVRFVNTVDEPYTVWLKSEQSDRWLRPELFLPRRSVVPVQIVRPGKHYLLVRDMAGRETHIGWVDLHAIAAAGMRTELLVDQLVVYETRTETVTVRRYREETRYDPR